MKQILTTIVIVVLSVCTAFGQETNQENGKNDWKEKIKSEKIAFFSSELSLTPEEAQAFWPVYNAYRSKCDDAHFATMKALWNLKKNEDASGKEMQDLVRAYKSASANEYRIIMETPDYSNILPIEKEAKLYVTEEMFRMKMIGKLRKNGPGPGGQNRNREQ
ncbi:MAG: hypothetical protein LKK19_00635 [Bacteroidales bacterium]|jgi:hypothetical protein|nr:hypothetical protein [Bacteroidales bacterium]MCI2121196.1 hypothetical protein [Bacteroidales bacterium]MCI2145016.1 hypothetical protein [Bacteroidales bacterium]